VEQIGLYQFHRPDPKVPFEDTVGALKELLDEGLIALAGISNGDVGQIKQANDILGGRLASVQNQFSPASAAARPSSSSARSWVSRSCRGARSAASPTRPGWGTGSHRSPRWRPSAG
jgi:diketogulonate reductase-like aldo/keto reductase